LEVFSVVFLPIVASKARFGKFQIARVIRRVKIGELQHFETTWVNYGPCILGIFRLKSNVAKSLENKLSLQVVSFVEGSVALVN